MAVYQSLYIPGWVDLIRAKFEWITGERGKQKSPTSNKPSPHNPTFNHLFSFNLMKKDIMKKSGLHIG